MFNLLITIGLCLIILLVMSKSRRSPFIYLLILGLLLILTLESSYFGAIMYIMAVMCILPAVIMLTPILRQKLLSNHFFKIMRKRLPQMSETEKVAIDSGTIGWEQHIFTGEPLWQHLNAVPVKTLSVEEQCFIDNEVQQLCALVSDYDIQKRMDLPKKAWDFIAKNRFYGIIIPKEYGGLGFSATAHARIVSCLASRNSTLGVTVMVPNSLGPGELLMHYGTQQQKSFYLPRLAKGEEIPCFALTSPTAGSDAGSIEDIGELVEYKKGRKKTLGLCLNWNKRYITLAPIATLIGIAFKTTDPNGLLQKYFPNHPLAGKKDLGISCALIARDVEGITIGNRHNPMWLPFMNGPTRGENVIISIDDIIGGADYIGQGWRMLIESLAAGRGISLPSLSVAGTQVALFTSAAYAGAREQFNTPIANFEGIQEPLGEIAQLTYSSKALCTFTTDTVDDGQKPALLAAMAKYSNTDQFRQAMIHAMDIHGGRAIMTGPANYLESLYRSAPVGITVEGANILTRSMMIFGQGAMRCHPLLIREINALSNTHPDLGRIAFDEALFEHGNYHLRCFSRSFIGAISRGKWLSADCPTVLKSKWQSLTHLSASFAWISDLSLLLLGGTLKRKESLSGLLADAWTHLVIVSTVLRHWHNFGYMDSHRTLVDALTQKHLCLAENAMIKVCDSMPISQPARWFIRFLAFPLGKRHPMHKLDHVLAIGKATVEGNEIGLELNTDIYVGKKKDDPLFCISQAFYSQKIINDFKKRSSVLATKRGNNESFEDWIKTLVDNKILTVGEQKTWIKARTKVQAAMQVDDFPKL